MSELQARDKTYLAPTYARFPVEIVRGEGSEVFDGEGRRYIDLTSGIGVTAFGIADREWVAAVTDQLTRVQHTSNLFYTEPCVRLAEALCARTGMKRVFFSNSGAEANECAIKTARKYAAEHKGEDYYTILTMENGFHGRTLATLAATGQAHYHELFQPLPVGFVHARANDMEDFLRVAGENKLAAVMVECIQGEGGVNPLDDGFLRAVAAYASENDILLIVDEVQTGNGRTGKLYAYQHAGITPDLVTTAKGLGGGLPLGACLFGEKVEATLGAGDHGSTFGGNPVACAGACNVLARLDGEMLAAVTEKGNEARAYLEGKAGITSVSGRGLMLGIETVAPVGEVLAALRERGVLALSAKTKLRLLPALNIKAPVWREALEIIADVCRTLAEKEN